ncbi:unnamed protein product [Aspergillus oryzae var. brunneus]|uniref:Unnamed protein product n=1 Tax=Aspergillus oryzae var. brunneus TaxID=332754 RepID=A0ABQ6LFI9_ASPOZ|nr:unnamed protein product [Aspergillus oryzae]GMG53616.1 unnamed protein product [Aspergillus oryzae var. brunneus]
MVLVKLLTIVHTAQDLNRDKVLNDSSGSLYDDEDIGNQAHHTVRRGEACMTALVDFDDDEARDKGRHADGLDEVMDARAFEFLLGCRCGLEDECSLNLEE